MSTDTLRIRIASETDVTRAIIETGNAAARLEFRVDQKSRITTAASELARNILKYAVRGEITVRILREPARVGVELSAHDSGPGIEDVDAALRDHVSTGGTLGLGLPGVRRLMDEFAIESAPASGTRVTVVLWRP
ncbi:MAG: ATP-binding protein [Candidatus Binatia bacterium]